MIVGLYCLAGVPVRITSLYSEVHQMCAEYVTDQSPQFEIAITQQEIEEEGRQSDNQRELEGLPEYHYPDAYLETLAVYRKLATALLAHNVLLIHGSVVAVDGEAYLFTALSGTGKSTHVRLWRELFGNRAVMVNDDKPLVRVCQDKIIVYGTPWDGKHHLSSPIAVPLRAIVYLQRGRENVIVRQSVRELFPILLQQTFRPEDPAASLLVLQLLNQLSEKVTLYSLHCNMEPEAALVAYEGMR